MVKKTKKGSVKCGIHHAFEITQVKMVWISHTCSSLFPSRPAKATSSFWVQFPNFNNPEKQGFLTKNNVVKQIKRVALHGNVGLLIVILSTKKRF